MLSPKVLPALAALALMSSMSGPAFANGGPFIVEYPNGELTTRSTFSRLDGSLRPARESRLRVVKEDLKVVFSGVEPTQRSSTSQSPGTPLAAVTAQYTISNPTKQQIEVDFGFPIIRSVSSYADVTVSKTKSDVGSRVRTDLIAYPAIWGIIREHSRDTIDSAIASDKSLQKLVGDVRTAGPAALAEAQAALTSYLMGNLKWNDRDAALMVAYARINLDDNSLKRVKLPAKGLPEHDSLNLVQGSSLGSLQAIGPQKATQFLAQLAKRFDPKAAETYESVFAAWGADVTQRSVDFVTGRVRPHELTIKPETNSPNARTVTSSRPGRYRTARVFDPTVYARVSYMDEHYPISESEKACCRSILKNLPVVFTFAPMDILHYRIVFPAQESKLVTVSYSQRTYRDTRHPETHQLAYLIHPASHWDHFGPIHLEVAVPENVPFKASTATRWSQTAVRDQAGQRSGRQCDIYRGVIEDKTGCIFLAVDAESVGRYARGEKLPTPAAKLERAAVLGTGHSLLYGVLAGILIVATLAIGSWRRAKAARSGGADS